MPNSCFFAEQSRSSVGGEKPALAEGGSAAACAARESSAAGLFPAQGRGVRVPKQQGFFPVCRVKIAVLLFPPRLVFVTIPFFAVPELLKIISNISN